MADSWKVACSWRGCAELVKRRERLCPTHRKILQKKETREAREKNPEEQLFYNTPVWEKLTRARRVSEPNCRECAKRGRQVFGHLTDHIVPLKLAWFLRTEPSNLQTLCQSCHNKKRAIEAKMYQTSKVHAPVTIVCGPPCSGKTTYVEGRMRRGEIVVDFDKIFAALTGLPMHDKPKDLLGFVLRVRTDILSHLCLMGAERPRTWIIITGAARADREKVRSLFEGEVRTVVLSVNADECISRLMRKQPDRADRQDVTEAIRCWWEDYEPEPETDNEKPESEVSV